MRRWSMSTASSRIFNALLRLAEIDTGMRRSGFVAVNAAEVARQAVDFYLPAAELKGVGLSYQGAGPARISGDPVLLAQAIGNLIDNALKYTAEGGAISVEVQAVADANGRDHRGGRWSGHSR